MGLKVNRFDYLLLLLIVFLVIRIFFFQTYRVESDSMVPTIIQGDRILCLRPFLFSKPQRSGEGVKWKLQIRRGDILVFHPPLPTSEEYIKRAVGMENEWISLVSNHVYIDGEPLWEPYLSDDSTGYAARFTSVLVTNDSLFMLGDNRNNSSDSRVWGPVSYQRIEGRIFAVIWPLRRFHLVVRENKKTLFLKL